MADATYDVIVVGAGHNALVCAAYLAEAGLDVAVVERRHEVGGGASTEEMCAPGFLSNNHAHFMSFWQSPVYKDFKLWEYGLHFMPASPAGSFIFDDNTALVTYAWRDWDPITCEYSFNKANAEKTVANIARFSKRDAEMAWVYWEKFEKYWADAYARWLLNPPPSQWEEDPLEKLCNDPEETLFEPWYSRMTIHQLVRELFDSVELRVWAMRAAMSGRGLFPEDTGGLSIIPGIIGNVYGWTPTYIPLGATHAVAHALQKAVSDRGGQYIVLSECDKFIMEDDKIKGIRFLDGSEISAKMAVVCNVDHQQVFFRFLGEDYMNKINPKVARRAKHIFYDHGPIYWSHFAIHELPKWKAADWDPNLPGHRCFWGPKDENYVGVKHKAELYSTGLPSKVFIHDAYDSIWVSDHSPAGKHIVLSEQYAPPTYLFSEKEWMRLKKEIINLTIEQWQWYAPNMTWDNIIGAYCNTPLDAEQRNLNMIHGAQQGASHIEGQMGKFRPFPDIAGYKVPGIENLYFSPNAHHGQGGVFGAPGYNCYKVMAKDFGLPKLEDKFNRPY